MSARTGTFTKSILARIEKRLESLSFHKERAGLVCDLEKESLGWIGLPVSTRLRHDRIGVAPVVGVVFKPIEELTKALSKSSQFVNELTLSTPVGYLTPEGKFLQWVFDPLMPTIVDGEIDKILLAVRGYGLPFMREHSKLDMITDALEMSRFTITDLRRYRLPVAYLLAGRKNEALRIVEGELESIIGRTDSAAGDYRDFARALRERAAPNS
jgi:hypothetical protein